MTATFNLTRSLAIANHFRAFNLFYYPAECAEWLTCVEKVAVLLNQMRDATLSAAADAAAVHGMIRARSDRMEALMVDDLVTIARLKSGAARGASAQQLYATEMAVWETETAQALAEGTEPPPRPNIQPPTPGMLYARPDDPEEAIKSYFDKRKIIEEYEAKNAIKDASVMMLPYKGVLRRSRKLAHNVDVLDRLIDERLYVPSAAVQGYVKELIFKGLWNQAERSTFNRIVSAFIGSRPWSQRARALAAEWQKILDAARNVSDQRGRVYFAVVEQALQYTGVAV